MLFNFYLSILNIKKKTKQFLLCFKFLILYSLIDDQDSSVSQQKVLIYAAFCAPLSSGHVMI